MTGYLLDTNVVSELIKTEPDPRVFEWVAAVGEPIVFLSVLTIGEIRKGIVRLPPGARRQKLEEWLQSELRVRFAGRILPVIDSKRDHAADR